MYYNVDYDPETQTFSLVDYNENCVIIVTKKQLEALLILYKRCCYENREGGEDYV